ncbi:MAG: ABC transporter substrate-binding protein [Verrucomicrobiota bacterium]|nr:ABC transporter substrate-binding protein [Verrucomicrobiota bacterium]
MYKSVPILLIIFTFFLNAKTEEESKKKRIISLAPAVTEELFLLDAGDEVVGVSSYCKQPIETQQKKIVGTIITADIEKILTLKPDILIITPLFPIKLKEKLKSLRIKTKTSRNPKNYEELCKNFLFVADLVGKREKAQKMLSEVQKKLNKLKKKTKTGKKEKIFIQLGAKPIYTIIHESYFTDLINFAGGINSVPLDYKGAYYSRERVLVDNPDHIFIMDMGKIGENEKNIWQKFKIITAVKNSSIHIVDSSKIGSTTPFSFLEMVKFFSEKMSNPKTDCTKTLRTK